MRSERSLSRGFPSLELDTVIEERSDPDQTQVNNTSWLEFSLISLKLIFLSQLLQTDLMTPDSPCDPLHTRDQLSSTSS